MKFKGLMLGAVASVALLGTANAGYERDGWYIGAEAGWGRVNETNFDVSNVPLKLDDGLAGMVTIGSALKNSNWRLEGELGYRTNDGTQHFSCGTSAAPATCAADISLTEWSGMFNAIYDFNLNSERWGMSLGAGAGIDNPRYNNRSGLDSNDKVFAYQAIAGLTYRVNQHWDIDMNYRYFNAAEADLVESAGAVPRAVNLEKHSVTVGFRYGYNEPPAAPVEAPAVVVPPPAAPKQFIVFFGFNKCNITAEADAVLSEAASAAKSTGSASVKVVGHTDTSGSTKYNQKLSECRANAVKTNLVGKGVGEGAISTSGKGETELMVQTGDSVKEPQNRRATVDLQ
jgi:outer membrane protein OmpA-like peptidoglycan-associated protein